MTHFNTQDMRKIFIINEYKIKHFRRLRKSIPVIFNQAGNGKIHLMESVKKVFPEYDRETYGLFHENGEELDINNVREGDTLLLRSNVGAALRRVFIKIEGYNKETGAGWYSGKTITIDVNTWDTILNIKRKIWDKEGIHDNQQNLIFDGRTLRDDTSLYDYTTISGANTMGWPGKIMEIGGKERLRNTIHLNVTYDGRAIPTHDGRGYTQKMPLRTYAGYIFVKMGDLMESGRCCNWGKTIELHVKLSDTIKSVKTQIQHLEGIIPAEQYLTFNGLLLEDDRILKDYNINTRHMEPVFGEQGRSLNRLVLIKSFGRPKEFGPMKESKAGGKRKKRKTRKKKKSKKMKKTKKTKKMKKTKNKKKR